MTRPALDILTELELRDLRTLVERAAQSHHVGLSELLSPGRDYLATRARQAVWVALRGDTEVHWSYCRIAKLFGVDRATVRYALKGRPGRRAA